MERLYKWLLVLAVTAAGVLQASAQSGRIQPTPTPTPVDDTLRIFTEEIKLNVLAFDSTGNFFRDVTVNDIVITENDVLHQPASVRRLNANVLIVMDAGGELRSAKSLSQTRKVAAELIGALREGDSVAVLAYADKAEVAGEWTTDKAEALAAVKRTKMGRRSLIVEALRKATDMLLRDSLENKHLVLITDGTDDLGRTSARFDAFERLKATDISVHVISYTDLEVAALEPRTKTVDTSPNPPPSVVAGMPDEVLATLPNGVRDKGVKIGPRVNLDRSLTRRMRSRKSDLITAQAMLDQLATDTNGEFILPQTVDEMREKAVGMARMIDSVYVVTYTPKVPVVATRGVAERKIAVTSKRPGLDVVARRRLLIRSSAK